MYKTYFFSLFTGILFLYKNVFLDNKQKKEAIGESVSVLTFGAKGNGLNDDTEAFEKAIIYCIKNNKVCSVPKTANSYNIASTIRIALEPDQSIKIVSNGAVIKPLASPLNKSAYNLTLYKEHIFLSIGKEIDSFGVEMFSRSANTSISISGLVLDGSNLKEQFATTTFDTDIFIGLQVLAENVNISNCVFQNIYGYGLRVHNVKNSTITNSRFVNVGGRGGTEFAQKTDKDALGDGIYHSLVKKDGIINIRDCSFKGKKIQNKRSRSAITFEYSTQPYKINLDKLNISGFAKCIHIEEVSPTIVHIDQVKMSDFNMGIANVLNNQSSIFFNNVNMEIGTGDGNESGDALAFLNYQSTAKIYVNNSVLDFNGRKEAYQSAVGLTKVENSTIKGNGTNFFFADGSTVFNNCIFVGFGGKGMSFFSNNGKSSYQILNSTFNKVIMFMLAV